MRIVNLDCICLRFLISILIRVDSNKEVFGLFLVEDGHWLS